MISPLSFWSVVIAFYLFDVLALGHRIQVAYINYPRVESYLRMHRPRNMKDFPSHRADGRASAVVPDTIGRCSLPQILDDDAVAETLLTLSHRDGRERGILDSSPVT